MPEKEGGGEFCAGFQEMGRGGVYIARVVVEACLAPRRGRGFFTSRSLPSQDMERNHRLLTWRN